MLIHNKKIINLNGKLEGKLDEFNILTIDINDDINKYIAELFTSEKFIASIFGKIFENMIGRGCIIL